MMTRALIIAQRRGVGGPRGFSLVEGVLGLVIAGLLVVLAVTALQRNRHRAALDNLANDLRGFATAFQDYRRKQPVWPPAAVGESPVPRGMEAALKDTTWTQVTPVGGRYDWAPPVAGEASGESPAPNWDGRGAILITAFSPSFPLELSAADLAYLDAKIDDGNLATGRFRTGFNGWPVLLVGEQP